MRRSLSCWRAFAYDHETVNSCSAVALEATAARRYGSTSANVLRSSRRPWSPSGEGEMLVNHEEGHHGALSLASAVRTRCDRRDLWWSPPSPRLRWLPWPRPAWPRRAGWNAFLGSRDSGTPRSRDPGDRRRRRARGGGRGRGSHGRDEPELGRTFEHAASGRLRDAGGRQGADDHERDVERHHAAHLHLPVAPLRQDRRKLRRHLRRDRQHVHCCKGADGDDTLRVVVTAKNADGSESATQRPDRGHRRRAGDEQRLPCRQEREDRADRRALTARADSRSPGSR